MATETKGLIKEEFDQWISGKDWLEIPFNIDEKDRQYRVFLTPQGNVVWLLLREGGTVTPVRSPV